MIKHIQIIAIVFFFLPVFANAQTIVGQNNIDTVIDLQFRYLNNSYPNGTVLQILNNNESGISGTTTSATVYVIEESDPFEFGLTLHSCDIAWTFNASSTPVCGDNQQQRAIGAGSATSTVESNGYITVEWTSPYVFDDTKFYRLRYTRSNSTGLDIQSYSIGAKFGASCYWAYRANSVTELYEDCPNMTSDIFYSINGIDGFDTPPTAEYTRIIDNIPDMGTEFGSTTTGVEIGADVFVSPPDFALNEYELIVTWEKNDVPNSIIGPNTCILGIGPLCLYDPLNGRTQTTYEVTNDYFFSTSTMHEVSEHGRYNVVSTLVKKKNLWPDEILQQKTSYFVIGDYSAYDQFLDSSYNSLEDLYTDNVGSCNLNFGDVLDFSLYSSLSECLIKLIARIIVPTPEQFSDLIYQARTDILTRFPWGYGTRLYDIFVSTDVSTTTLPSTAIDIPDNLPMAGRTIDFDLWDEIPLAWDRIGDVEVETIDGRPTDKFLYWWDLMWKIAFALWLLRLFYGIFQNSDFSQNVNSRKRFEEDVKKSQRGLAVNKEAQRRGANKGFSDNERKKINNNHF